MINCLYTVLRTGSESCAHQLTAVRALKRCHRLEPCPACSLRVCTCQVCSLHHPSHALLCTPTPSPELSWARLLPSPVSNASLCEHAISICRDCITARVRSLSVPRNLRARLLSQVRSGTGLGGEVEPEGDLSDLNTELDRSLCSVCSAKVKREHLKE